MDDQPASTKHETLEELQDRAKALAREMDEVVPRPGVVARDEACFDSMIIRDSVDNRGHSFQINLVKGCSK